MDVQSLIRLAHQADLEGNYRVADKLTEKAIREAQFFRNIGRQIGDFLGNMNVGRGSRDIANQSLNVTTGNALTGPGGTVQQMVGATADAANDFKLKTRNTGARTVLVTLPDGRQVPTTGNMNRLLPIIDQLSPEDQAIVRARAQGMGNLKSRQTAQSGASASAVGDASSGDAASGIAGGINKADRFKSHNITGITGPAAVGLAGVVAALGGLGMYLMNGKVVDQRGNPVPPDRIPDDIKRRIPQFQMMTRREEAGQISGGKALSAQNFVDANSSNPRLKNQRDWYNYALQTSGGDRNFANNVISFVKASPEIPSQIGGGPNI